MYVTPLGRHAIMLPKSQMGEDCYCFVYLDRLADGSERRSTDGFSLRWVNLPILRPAPMRAEYAVRAGARA
jgi:hypothetical protein